MKNTFILTMFLMSGIWFSSCNKEDSEPAKINLPDTTSNIQQPTPSIMGTASFFIDTSSKPSDRWYYGFDLWIEGKHIGTNNFFFTGYEPNCGNWYVENYWDTARDYTFHIETFNGNYEYDGQFTILPNDGCTKIRLRDQHN